MTRRTAPAVVGLLIAWGGTALLVSPLGRQAIGSSSLRSDIFSQIALWLLLFAVLAIVVLWERRPFATLWLEPLRWQSWAWAGVLTLVSVLIFFPLTEWIRQALGLPGYAFGITAALEYPVWLRVVAVLTAGVVEETLFRGFAVTRLLQLGANTPLAVVVSSAVFAALHLPAWGAGPTLAFFISGLATTTFFVWRKDLATMIIAHAAIDLWGLVITPAVSQWWTT